MPCNSKVQIQLTPLLRDESKLIYVMKQPQRDRMRHSGYKPGKGLHPVGYGPLIRVVIMTSRSHLAALSHATGACPGVWWLSN